MITFSRSFFYACLLSMLNTFIYASDTPRIQSRTLKQMRAALLAPRLSNPRVTENSYSSEPYHFGDFDETENNYSSEPYAFGEFDEDDSAFQDSKQDEARAHITRPERAESAAAALQSRDKTPSPAEFEPLSHHESFTGKLVAKRQYKPLTDAEREELTKVYNAWEQH